MKTKILLHLFILAMLCTTSVFNAYALTTAPPFSGHISGGGTTHWFNSSNGGFDIYPINGPVYIDNGSTLQIDPNVTIQFDPGQSLLVYGNLDANAGNITFTSSGGTSPGSWGSILLEAGSIADLTGAAIEYGNEIDVDGTLTLNGTFISTMYYGLAIESSANVSMTNNTIINSCTYPIEYNGPGSLNGTTNTLSGNTFSSNTYQAILMNFSSNSNSLTLPTASIPYYFPSSYVVGSITGSLTIEPGNILEFNNGQSLVVYGTLDASVGSIIFTSSGGTLPGSWGGIALEAGSIADLTGAIIEYGNEIYVDGTLTLTGSTINTMINGLVIDEYANVSMTTTTIENWKQGNYPIVYYGPGSINGIGSPGNTSNSLAGNIFSGTSNYVAILVNFAGNSNSFTLPTSTASPATIPPNMVIPYYFPSSYQVDSITGSLTIEPGNILKFGINQGLYVYGTLTADAPGNTIYFTSIYDDNLGGDANGDGNSTQPASQNWVGVVFTGSRSNASQMSYCQVRFAGAGTNIGAVTMYDASPTFNRCTFSNSYFGAAIYYASGPVFTADTFASADMTPIAMSLEALPAFTNIDLNHTNIFSFENNKYQAIGLLPGTLTANGDLSQRAFGISNTFTLVTNITYLLLGQIIIPPGITMTIDPGIVIKGFNQSQSLLVEGTLIANGHSQDSMITFTSAADDNFGQPGDTNDNGDITSPVVGDWGGIIFDSTATNSNTTASILNFCRIQYASTSGYFYQTTILGGAIATIQASPTISNCNINNTVYGILCYFSSNPTITDDSLLDITSTPIAITPAAHPVFTGCTFTNVGLAALGLIGGNVGVSGCVIQQNVAGITNITYVLLTDMTINSGTYVCVSPGVVIKINGRISIYVNGGFKATGAIFSSIKDDNVGHPGDTNEDGNATFPAPYDWGTIQYNAGSDDNYDILSLDMISYSGAIDYNDIGWGGVNVINASPTVSNTTIASSYYGVYCNGTAAPLLDSIIIKDCVADPVAMSLVSNPVFNDIQFIANLTSGVRILEGTLAVNATLTQRSIAGIANVAYLINDLIIGPLVTFTIDSGVVIKMGRKGDYCTSKIQVHGALIARGAANDDIVFTSSADDAAGGDTNNDGSSSSPSPGDWDGIDFFSTSDSAKSTLMYCDIRYGGAYNSPCSSFGYPYAQGMVKVRDTKVNIDSCIFRLSGTSSIGIFGAADPLIENNLIENNNAGTPVYMSMFSNPAFANNTVLNTNLFALGIVPETYSENAVVPQRNFAGYNNISYYIYPVGGGSPSLTINAGTTIAIPAGTVFKGNTNPYNNIYSPMIAVNGTLLINGVADSAVVFTDYRDDTYGNPADMNQDGSLTQPSYTSYPSFGGNNGIIAFNAVSNNASYIKYAIMRYSNVGVSLLSASPGITHCYFDNLNYGIELNGVSTPVVDYNTFNNLSFAPLITSLVSYPSSTISNTISGTTYAMIGVLSETLSQNVTLPQRNFAGKNNIPYFFTTYTVGTNAVLTIEPGVRCKFYNGYYEGVGITVNNGLMAVGTPTAPIVFTSWKDDAYGGDSNSDSTATTPDMGDWTSITFNNTSVAPFCQMSYCIFRYGGGASYYVGPPTGVITAANASPSISYSNFNNNYEGVMATGAANPMITSCCFENNASYAINNVNQSFNITATNNFWGDPSGPTYSGNPGGSGEAITASVNYTPFQTECSTSPLMGDVSLNGVVTSYDASLVLQYAVSLITLNSAQLYVGNVSAADIPGSVAPDGPTAFDATLILQYVVGDIGTFPADARLSGNPYQTNPDLIVGSANTMPGDTIIIPLRTTNDSNLLSIELTLQYDTTYLQYVTAVPALSSMLTSFNNISNEEQLKIAMAGTQALTTDTTIAWVTFCVKKNVQGTITTPISVLYFLANETDLTSSAKQGVVTINAVTGIAKQNASNGFTVSSIYPNPFNNYTVITYQMANSQNVRIVIYDIIGKEVSELLNETQNPGIHSITWDGEDKQGSRIETGIYFLNIESDDFNETERIVVIK